MVQDDLDYGTLKELTNPRFMWSWILDANVDHPKGIHPNHQAADSDDGQSQ